MGELVLVTSSGIELTWNPESRLAVLRFQRETHATGRDAAELVESLAGWVGTDGRAFGLLGDGGRLSGLDAEYRSIWGKFFRQHRERSTIAFFGMGPIIRIAAEMFRIGTGLQLKAFAAEDQARAWLCTRGISA